MFMKPDMEPENRPPISAVIAQYELCDKYMAPAPPARITLADGALFTVEPNARKMAVSAIPTIATPHRPARRLIFFVKLSAINPPTAQPIAIARNGKVP